MAVKQKVIFGVFGLRHVAEIRLFAKLEKIKKIALTF